MKHLIEMFLAFSLTGCSLQNLTITQIPQPTQAPQPEQEAIDAMLQFWSGGQALEKMKIIDFTVLNLSDADNANGIEQRVCIAVSYIRKNDEGVWEDWYVSLPMDKIAGKWDVNRTIKEDLDLNKSGFDRYGKTVLMISGNCNWARERYGIATSP